MLTGRYVEAEDMPNELDRICADFAGLAKTRWWSGANTEPEYPPVSTSGAAMLRLMDALKAKGVFFTLRGNHPQEQTREYLATACWIGGSHTHRAVHDSGPMALALAVAELAKAGER